MGELVACVALVHSCLFVVVVIVEAGVVGVDEYIVGDVTVVVAAVAGVEVTAVVVVVVVDSVGVASVRMHVQYCVVVVGA